MKALVIDGFKKGVSGIPPGLRKFLLRGALLFVGWRILYELVLKPAGVPDNQLTQFILWGTYNLLSPFYDQLSIQGFSILIGGKTAITVAPACNGLELMVLYAGFLLCFPAKIKRMSAFILSGITLIVVLNMLRCAVLAIMFHNQHALADFMHHYLFKLAIYAVTFYLWVLYSKNNALKKA